MKILRAEEYNDLIIELETYKEVSRIANFINEKLESKIEKMKCCANCKNGAFEEGSFYCNGTVPIKKRYFDKCNNWKLYD